MGKLLIPRITAVQRLSFIPGVGEFLHDTTDSNVYHGDGITVGGHLIRSATNEGDSVVFLGSQAEYDAFNWVQGDIFIPTISGITTIGNAINARASVITITFTDSTKVQYQGADFSGMIGVNNFFTATGSSPQIDVPLISFARPESGGSVANQNLIYQQENDSYAVHFRINVITSAGDFGEQRSEKVAALLNALPIEGGTGAGAEIPIFDGATLVTNEPEIRMKRNCVAASNGDVLTITSNYLGLNSSIAINDVYINASGEPLPTVDLFQGENASQILTFIQNRIYVRRDGNDGWLEYNTAVLDFIEG